MSNIQKQHKISPAIAWLTIQKFIIFYCPLDGEHTRLSRGEAFLRLYGQVTVNRWDQAESARVLDAVEALLRRVPAFLLDCTISEEAVDCLYEALYPATVAETVRLRACL